MNISLFLLLIVIALILSLQLNLDTRALITASGMYYVDWLTYNIPSVHDAIAKIWHFPSVGPYKYILTNVWAKTVTVQYICMYLYMTRFWKTNHDITIDIIYVIHLRPSGLYYWINKWLKQSQVTSVTVQTLGLLQYKVRRFYGFHSNTVVVNFCCEQNFS